MGEEEVMAPENVRKLLGGWAAGTLTESERKALLEAALEDQELFNEMMAEQPLKELLDDSAARAELLAAVGAPRRGGLGWLLRPWPMAAAGATVATVVIIGFAIMQREPERRTVAEVAVVRPPVAQAPAPAPVAPPKRVIPKPKPQPLIQPPPIAVDRGAVGGVPGGVIGGIVRAPAAAPPPPPPAQAANAPARKDAQTMRFEAAMPPAEVFRSSLSANLAKSKAAPQEVLTLRILKRNGEGEFREAERGATFNPGDAVVISVDVAQAGVLQLFEGDQALSPLTPVQPGQRYTLPRAGAIELTGDRTLSLRLTTINFTEPVNIPITLKMRQ